MLYQLSYRRRLAQHIGSSAVFGRCQSGHAGFRGRRGVETAEFHPDVPFAAADGTIAPRPSIGQHRHPASATAHG